MQKVIRKSRQAGFTLVEIAIVLVIVGLLLAGVLKGQELIENSRVKSAANDMNGIAAAYNSYLDRFKRLPGDDGPIGTLTGRGGSWGTLGIAAGNNDGVILAAVANTFNGAAGEGPSFFQHLRAAGFLTGNPGDVGIDALPTNAWGGRIGIVNVAGVQGRTAAKLLICLGNVPGKSARAIDTQIDDGLSNNGAVRATQGANNQTPTAAAAAAAYSDDQTYTICRDLG